MKEEHQGSGPGPVKALGNVAPVIGTGGWDIDLDPAGNRQCGQRRCGEGQAKQEQGESAGELQHRQSRGTKLSSERTTRARSASPAAPPGTVFPTPPYA